mmetsp:Transcript_4892/g.14220  ORF Transcript_4892/g.14220 Transcript_4892/m.14220 type:complete len:203 (-) Transcript_4892:1176-1784(-)
MLRSQVHPPLHRYLELRLRGLFNQYLNTFCVRDTSKRLCQKVFQALHESFLHRAVKELKIFQVVIQGILNAELQVVLSTIHVVEQICKCQLRLDHPEFSQVPGSVGVLSSEGRPKGVGIGQGATEGLHSKLAADSHEGRLSEEVLRVVDLTSSHRQAILLCIGKQGCHLEHLTSPLAICCRDERRVHVQETSRPEELMGSLA